MFVVIFMSLFSVALARSFSVFDCAGQEPWPMDNEMTKAMLEFQGFLFSWKTSEVKWLDDIITISMININIQKDPSKARVSL